MNLQRLQLYQRDKVGVAPCCQVPGGLQRAFGDRGFASGYRAGARWDLGVRSTKDPAAADFNERVSFSPLARKLALLYERCALADSGEGRRAAVDGVEQLRQAAASPRSRTLFKGLMKGVDRCEASGAGVWRYLAVIGRLADLGVEPASWLEALFSIADGELLRAFLDESLDLVAGEREDRDTLELFEVFIHVWRARQAAAAEGALREKRRYYRKRMDIPGRFQWLRTGLGADIVIRDLCPEGIGFVPLGDRRLDKNELIRVSFPLDGLISRYIHKLAVIRRFDGLVAGAQFC